MGPAPALAASVQAAEAIKSLAGRPEASRRLLVFDLWQRSFEEVEVKPNPDCPSCAKRSFDALQSKGAAQAMRLCGRNSVEILPEKAARLDLKKLEETLSKTGKVQYNGYSLWFEAGKLELVVFPDGRAIVKGTADPAEAKAAYGRFISL
jgi:adenylyltransferase/sulfurtransferase